VDKLKIARPVIVEGKYDKMRLSSVIDAEIITTDGFGIFNRGDKTRLIRALAEKCGGVIVLTDSDGAGLVIRNYFSSILPPDKVTHVYIPQTPGKERRKTAPSKSGYVGVEGIDCGILKRLLEPFSSPQAVENARKITKTDLYEDGLFGVDGSAAKREAFADRLGLPGALLSAKALLAAVNMLFTYDEYKAAINDIEAVEKI
jgi:ribonuclease M5